MKPVTKKQIAVLAGASIIVVLLLFANTKPIANQENTAQSGHAGVSNDEITHVVEEGLASLTPTQKSDVQKLKLALDNAGDKKKAFEQLISMCDSVRQPIAAAYYMEQAAIASGSEKNWAEAGKRYYTSVGFTQPAHKTMLFSKATDCFEKALALDPGDVEAKIGLAGCYVEGSAQPMKGIALLKEVEKVDSNNVNLQLSFAFFSEKSGQWDKAIKRFEKVLAVRPDLIDVYLHMADAYRQMGDTQNAIKSLEKYITLVDDVLIKTEIQNYINQLKNS